MLHLHICLHFTSLLPSTCVSAFSQDADHVSKMRSQKAVNRCMDYLREGVTPHVHLLIMLLCNLTLQDAGCQELLQLGQGDLEGWNV